MMGSKLRFSWYIYTVFKWVTGMRPARVEKEEEQAGHQQEEEEGPP